MKVLFILSLSKGGLVHYTAELANAVAKYEHVMVIKPKMTDVDNIFSDKIDVRNWFLPFPLYLLDLYHNASISKFMQLARGFISYRNVKLIHELDPDIIHIPTGVFPFIRIFLKLYKIDESYPLVVTHHEIPSNKLHLSRSMLTNLYIAVNNIVPAVRETKSIVHREEAKNLLIRRGYNEKQIHIIPHGAYSFFVSYNNPNIKEEDNTVLFFGRIIPDKGLDLIIEAILRVRDKIPNVKLIIAGQGEISESSRMIINKYSANFEVHNRYILNEEVGSFFQRAKIVVPYAGSKRGFTGLSGALTIAYTYGKPVVVTNVDKYKEWVEEVGCGFVVPPGDTQAFANAIIELLENEKLRRKMRKKALEKAKELSWDNIAKKHIEIYREAIGEFKLK